MTDWRANAGEALIEAVKMYQRGTDSALQTAASEAERLLTLAFENYLKEKNKNIELPKGGSGSFAKLVDLFVERGGVRLNRDEIFYLKHIYHPMRNKTKGGETPPKELVQGFLDLVARCLALLKVDVSEVRAVLGEKRTLEELKMKAEADGDWALVEALRQEIEAIEDGDWDFAKELQQERHHRAELQELKRKEERRREGEAHMQAEAERYVFSIFGQIVRDLRGRYKRGPSAVELYQAFDEARRKRLKDQREEKIKRLGQLINLLEQEEQDKDLFSMVAVDLLSIDEHLELISVIEEPEKFDAKVRELIETEKAELSRLTKVDPDRDLDEELG